MEYGAFISSLIVLLALAFGWFVYSYMRLSALRKEIDKSYLLIHDNIKVRNDTALKLFDAAKTHEATNHLAIELGMRNRHDLATCAERVRSFSTDPKSMNSLINAYTAMSSNLQQLADVIASSNKLEQTQKLQPLLNQLAMQENNFEFAQQFFNDAVRAYNKQRKQFPCALVAASLGFRRAGMLNTMSSQPSQSR